VKNPLRWGILGAGHIAGKWARDLGSVPDAVLQAVWARDPGKTREFAEAHGAARPADSVDDLLGRGDLDAVYVATPHGRHLPDTLACLEAGIPVLCEKAFALDAAQAREMALTARSRGVFLMEALWTRFLPSFLAAKRWVASGEIGQILTIRSDFGFRAPYDPRKRLWDPAMGGGALLDIGLYPLFFAREFLGPFRSFEVDWTAAPNGVDREIRVAGVHDRGACSESLATFDDDTPCECLLVGERGTLRFLRMFHAQTDLVVVDDRGNTRRHPAAPQGHGYAFEIEHVGNCLREGRTESPVWPLERTLEQMELLDSIRSRMRRGEPTPVPRGRRSPRTGAAPGRGRPGPA
jgi:predicted dehydrogenase